jgi:NTP pyrophosphatase (non-canonical NTP hydrolase)|tara:strand:+ start:209 stop:559 length:351 start_codon:yes stop_codon:yes gene_type:complete
MNKEHTLANCQNEVDDWIRNVGVRYFSELTNTAILMEEVGELARLISRKFGEQSFKEGEEDDVGMEIADVFFVLVCIANQTGVDLQKEFCRTMKKKTIRDAERHANNPKLIQSENV